MQRTRAAAVEVDPVRSQSARQVPRSLAKKLRNAPHHLCCELCLTQLARVVRAARQLCRRLQQLRVCVGQATRDAYELGARFVKAADRACQRTPKRPVCEPFHRGKEERRTASGCAAREQRSIALRGRA